MSCCVVRSYIQSPSLDVERKKNKVNPRSSLDVKGLMKRDISPENSSGVVFGVKDHKT